MNQLEKIFWNSFAVPAQTNFPPMNIIKEGNDFRLELAVAGFKLEDLDVEYDGSKLEVRGVNKRSTANSNQEFIHSGLSRRNFHQTIAVRGQYDIEEVFLEDGILTIIMKDKVERIKPKIQIRDKTS